MPKPTNHFLLNGIEIPMAKVLFSLVGPGEPPFISFQYGYGPGAKQSQEEGISYGMGDIEPEATELGQEQSVKRERTSKV